MGEEWNNLSTDSIQSLGNLCLFVHLNIESIGHLIVLVGREGGREGDRKEGEDHIQCKDHYAVISYCGYMCIVD